MASKFPVVREGDLRRRKGHDMTWSCDKHAEPISFYCKLHKLSICDRCVIKEHCQKPCKLDDIEDVILVMKRKLDNLLPEIEEAKNRLKTLDSKIECSATFSTNHLQSLNDEVNATYDGKLKSVADKQQEEIRLINEEADEEIRIINEKRDKQIKACNKEAEQQCTRIRQTRANITAEREKIDKTVREKIGDFKRRNINQGITLDNMIFEINRILLDDQKLVNEAPQMIKSLDESLSANVHQDAVDYLDRMQREVQRVKFVEGEVGGEHCGRIDGYIGKWEIVKSTVIPSIVKVPCVRGLISNHELYVSDNENDDIYVTNISNEQTSKLEEGDSNMRITSCVPIDRTLTLCGKWKAGCKGDTLDGWVSLYNRQWELVRDITIPKNKTSSNGVYVDVDRDGMILAAEHSQCNIYVINPADGKIVNSIATEKMVFGGIHALSSGDILVQTGMNELTIFAWSGEKKVEFHSKDLKLYWCNVDKLTDTLYITYREPEHNIYAVDKMSCDGNIHARRIVEYEKSGPSRPCFITLSGHLVACNKDRLLVYKKNFVI